MALKKQIKETKAAEVKAGAETNNYLNSKGDLYVKCRKKSRRSKRNC